MVGFISAIDLPAGLIEAERHCVADAIEEGSRLRVLFLTGVCCREMSTTPRFSDRAAPANIVPKPMSLTSNATAYQLIGEEDG